LLDDLYLFEFKRKMKINQLTQSADRDSLRDFKALNSRRTSVAGDPGTLSK